MTLILPIIASASFTFRTGKLQVRKNFEKYNRYSICSLDVCDNS
jgi:hypothetical protein